MARYFHVRSVVTEHLRHHLRPHGLALRVREADSKAFKAWLRRYLGRGNEAPGAAVPVSPDRPSDLSGGAAAEMKFDE